MCDKVDEKYICSHLDDLIKNYYQLPWASCQIHKIAGCACTGNAGNVFPHHRGLAFPICIMARASRGKKKFRGIPGAYATCSFTYLVRGPFYTRAIPRICYERSFNEFYLSIWNKLVFNQMLQLFVSRHCHNYWFCLKKLNVFSQHSGKKNP